MSTIQSDVATEDFAALLDHSDDGSDAFLKSFEDKPDARKEPSEPEEDEEDTVTQDDAEDTEGSDESPDELDADDESGEDDETAKPDTDATKKYVDDDGHFVKIKVGDEYKETSVKDLKRLFGQEAALTQKSTEVANARKAAEADAQKYATKLNALLTRATEKANPYRNIDWMAVSKDPSISAEAASALRADAQRALDDEAFLGQNLNEYMAGVQQQEAAARVESAKACVLKLQTAPTEAAPNPLYIKGWNPKTYDETRAFGVKMGMPEHAVNTLTDPAAIKMMHMAMLYTRGAKKVVTTKVNKTPEKIVKTSSSPAARPSRGTVETTNALKTLKRSGSLDAAGDAFLASFADK